jgi:hypothetical protein
MTHNCDDLDRRRSGSTSSNNEALTAEQRAAGKKNYDELIVTAGFPNKPDGTPMV